MAGCLRLRARATSCWHNRTGGGRFLGTDDPETVVFGQNMTSLTFCAFAGAGEDLAAGDEVIVTRLDHDANVSPWVVAARDAWRDGAICAARAGRWRAHLDALKQLLSARTKWWRLAVSNATGTINPVREIAQWASRGWRAGFSSTRLHYAPHALIDVQSFGCDFFSLLGFTSFLDRTWGFCGGGVRC